MRWSRARAREMSRSQAKKQERFAACSHGSRSAQSHASQHSHHRLKGPSGVAVDRLGVQIAQRTVAARREGCGATISAIASWTGDRVAAVA